MKMQHAELIAHAAQHPDGWASLENQGNPIGQWRVGTYDENPVTYPGWTWRIKPATLKISVEIPRPDDRHEGCGHGLRISDGWLWFASEEEADEAERDALKAKASAYDYIRSGNVYIEPSEGELFASIAEGHGKYYKDMRDFDADIADAIAKDQP